MQLDVEMFHDESWKSIYFGVKSIKVMVTGHKNIVDKNREIFCGGAQLPP